MLIKSLLYLQGFGRKTPHPTLWKPAQVRSDRHGTTCRQALLIVLWCSSEYSSRRETIYPFVWPWFTFVGRPHRSSCIFVGSGRRRSRHTGGGEHRGSTFSFHYLVYKHTQVRSRARFSSVLEYRIYSLCTSKNEQYGVLTYQFLTRSRIDCDFNSC